MTNIFISHPSPYNKSQSDFLALIETNLNIHKLNPINLGKNNWSYKSPLIPIKELMLTCKAALIIGLERYHDYIGYSKQHSKSEEEYFHKYSSSSWIQIEAGMAYMAGLPLLILKEKKLLKEGILDANISEFFIFEFEIEKQSKKLSNDLQEILQNWKDHIL